MTSKSHISRLIESGDRVTPIFRKTGTIMLGADAFSRAEDIEQAVYYELPRLVEQLEAAHAELTEWRTSIATERLREQLEELRQERDAIGAALGEPCAECGHIDWRSDGYADAIMQRLRAADEAVEGKDALLAEADAQAARYETTIAALEKDRDSWEKVAREYEMALADRGAL